MGTDAWPPCFSSSNFMSVFRELNNSTLHSPLQAHIARTLFPSEPRRKLSILHQAVMQFMNVRPCEQPRGEAKTNSASPNRGEGLVHVLLLCGVACCGERDGVVYKGGC
jgi:hypothetical protein